MLCFYCVTIKCAETLWKNINAHNAYNHDSTKVHKLMLFLNQGCIDTDDGLDIRANPGQNT